EHFLAQRGYDIKFLSPPSPVVRNAAVTRLHEALLVQALECNVHRADVELLLQFFFETFEDQYSVCLVVQRGNHQQYKLFEFTKCVFFHGLFFSNRRPPAEKKKTALRRISLTNVKIID